MKLGLGKNTMKKFLIMLAYALGILLICDVVLRIWNWALDGSPIIKRKFGKDKDEKANLKKKAEGKSDKKDKKKDKKDKKSDDDKSDSKSDDETDKKKK